MLDSQNYGYISGRVTYAILNAAVDCGVPEDRLKLARVEHAYYEYFNKRGMFLWNDLMEFVRVMADWVGEEEELRNIGRSVYKFSNDWEYIKWLRKALSLNMALKIAFKYSVGYNFPNFNSTFALKNNVLELGGWLQHEGDLYFEPLGHLFCGIYELFPTMFGYAPMRSVTFELDRENRGCRYTLELPDRRSWFSSLKHWWGVIRAKEEHWELLGEHGKETREIEARRRKDQESMHRLLMGVSDCVIMGRGQKLLFCNDSALELMGCLKSPEKISDCFVWDTELANFLFANEDARVSKSGNQSENLIRTAVLIREGLPYLEVSIKLVSRQLGGGETEYLIQILDLTLPSDPREVAAFAGEYERKKVARDMHDGLGQLLTATNYQIASLKMAELDPEKIQKIDRVAGTLQEATLYARRFTRHLDVLIKRCVSLYEVVELLSKEFQLISGMHIRNHLSKELKLNGAEERSQFSFLVQECLNNALRHGLASEMQIASSYVDGLECITLTDNGQGMVVEEQFSGLGMRNLEYRAKQMGALLSIKSTLSKGTTVMLEFDPRNASPQCRKKI